MSEKHATLGASGAHRWVNCPGSVRLGADIPNPPSSVHAEEGTEAHELAESILRAALISGDFSGDEVDPDMYDNVQEFTNRVLGRIDPDTQVYLEERVDLGPFSPPVPMFGTADVILWHPGIRHLEVWDLKYGRGVYVDAKDNLQLQYYMLGAILKVGVRPDRVTTHIVQPRMVTPEGPHRWAEYTWPEILQIKDRILRAAHATQEEDAPLVPGSWCRWCKAQAVCPAQERAAVELAQSEFEVLEESRDLPAPTVLTDEQLQLILEKAPMIEGWFNAIREHVHQRLEAGEVFPGWKLVAKRATRRWADEVSAERYLRRKLKVAGTYKKSLISPAQAEAALKKMGQKLPENMVVASSSGTNLVHDSNPKPALYLPAAADEFDTE